MNKEYWKWHLVKAKLNDRGDQPFFYEREIWFCAIGLNVGREQDGKHDWFERPVLVLKKFNWETFWGVPLTTRFHENSYHYFRFSVNGKVMSASLSQLRLFDVRRILRKAGMMHEKDFLKLKEAIKKFLQ